MSPRPVRLTASIDLTLPGKRMGHLELAWSDNVHAYGIIPVPIGIIANGAGPCVLITAGVHGDEYEGLVIARRLYANIEPNEVTGTIVVMPAVNLPAVRAASRVSPIDRANMNRAFPGDALDGPTAMIADFIERTLLPRTNYAVDLHSGGTRSFYTPCGYIYAFGNEHFRKRKLFAAHAFGAPNTAVVAATSSGGSLSAACERHGVVMVATELGGGGVFQRQAMERGYEGTRAVLCHAGVLKGDISGRRTSLLHVESSRSAVVATIDGMFENAVDVGQDIEAGDVAGHIWPMDNPAREPVEARFAVAGTVLARRATPLVLAGDTLCHTGRRISDAEFLAIGDGGRS